jgi:hypothetical protein
MKRGVSKNVQSNELYEQLLGRLESRFAKHLGLKWERVLTKLLAQPDKLRALQWMDDTGGEPALTFHDEAKDEFVFIDRSPETPKGRLSLCYDDEALAARKEHKPKGSALGLAQSFGVDLLTETDYLQLQQTGEFDLKSSSWLKTPEAMRKLGGALFGDRRFGRVFVYHNGAQSYYSSRGFRVLLKV